jgi:hypothetical protein
VSDSHAARTKVWLEIELGGYLHNPHISRAAEFAEVCAEHGCASSADG